MLSTSTMIKIGFYVKRYEILHFEPHSSLCIDRGPVFTKIQVMLCTTFLSGLFDWFLLCFRLCKKITHPINPYTVNRSVYADEFKIHQSIKFDSDARALQAALDK